MKEHQHLSFSLITLSEILADEINNRFLLLLYSYILTSANELTIIKIKLKFIKYSHVFLTMSNLRQDQSFSKPGGASWLPRVFNPALTPWSCRGGRKLDHLLQEVHHALLQLQTLELQEALLLQGPMDFPASLFYGPTGPLLLLQHGLHQPQLLLLHGEPFTVLPAPG